MSGVSLDKWIKEAKRSSLFKMKPEDPYYFLLKKQLGQIPHKYGHTQDYCQKCHYHGHSEH